jgi:hypothetical protein
MRVRVSVDCQRQCSKKTSDLATAGSFSFGRISNFLKIAKKRTRYKVYKVNV